MVVIELFLSDINILFYSQADWVKVGYIPFGEASLKALVDLYMASCQLPVVVTHNVLAQIVKVILSLL